MLFDLIELLLRPDEYVCNWCDGELYIEPIETCVASAEKHEQTTKETADVAA